MKPILTSTLLFTGMLFAADFWQNKKPSEWTEKEARRIIENSPWVKETQPGMDTAAMAKSGRGGGGGRGAGGGGMQGGGGSMGGSMGGMGGGLSGPGGQGGGGPMGGDTGGQPAGMMMPRVRVAFETAMPVAEAKARMELQDVFKAVREEFVVISVSGMKMMSDGRAGASKGEDANERKKNLQDKLLQMTTIKLSADKVYQPAEAKVQQTVNGPVILFAFPRKELAIGPDDKQLQFKTSMGPVVIEVKFSLKDMVFEKQVSL